MMDESSEDERFKWEEIRRSSGVRGGEIEGTADIREKAKRKAAEKAKLNINQSNACWPPETCPNYTSKL